MIIIFKSKCCLLSDTFLTGLNTKYFFVVVVVLQNKLLEFYIKKLSVYDKILAYSKSNVVFLEVE